MTHLPHTVLVLRHATLALWNVNVKPSMQLVAELLYQIELLSAPRFAISRRLLFKKTPDPTPRKQRKDTDAGIRPTGFTRPWPQYVSVPTNSSHWIPQRKRRRGRMLVTGKKKPRYCATTPNNIWSKFNRPQSVNGCRNQNPTVVGLGLNATNNL